MKDMFQEHPWVSLENPMEVEAWMALNDQELQSVFGQNGTPAKPATMGMEHTQGQGLCFHLLHGGYIYLHTNHEGDVLLDVEEEAAWVVPLIVAATRHTAPRGHYWLLPGDRLVALILGLNSLIKSSRLVQSHDFRPQRYLERGSFA